MFIPCKETILDMTPTEFEKHSLRVLTDSYKILKIVYITMGVLY